MIRYELKVYEHVPNKSTFTMRSRAATYITFTPHISDSSFPNSYQRCSFCTHSPARIEDVSFVRAIHTSFPNSYHRIKGVSFVRYPQFVSKVYPLYGIFCTNYSYVIPQHVSKVYLLYELFTQIIHNY